MKLFSKRLVKKAKHQPVKERDPRGIMPERNWRAIFIAFVLLNLLMLGFHGLLFFKLSQGGFFSTPEAEPSSTEIIDRELLQSTLDYFRGKESSLIESIASPDPVPSVQ